MEIMNKIYKYLKQVALLSLMIIAPENFGLMKVETYFRIRRCSSRLKNNEKKFLIITWKSDKYWHNSRHGICTRSYLTKYLTGELRSYWLKIWYANEIKENSYGIQPHDYFSEIWYAKVIMHKCWMMTRINNILMGFNHIIISWKFHIILEEAGLGWIGWPQRKRMRKPSHQHNG